MKKTKIHILGASGTGKSTLAKALAEKLGCAYFDSDDYFHFPTDPPFQKQRSPEERATLLTADLRQHSSWVLSGGAAVWDPAPKVEYSLIVFLYLPPKIRLERLRQRELQLYGARIQGGGDMEATHKEFLEWTVGYDSGVAKGTNTLSCHNAFLRGTKFPTLRLEAPLSTQEQVEIILRKIGS